MATRNQIGSASALPLSLLAQAIPMLSRHDLEALTERLIDHLDALDGDPDLEAEEDACIAGDDGCAPFYIHGRLYWGSADEDRGWGSPRYGIDQSKGPLP